MVDDQNRDDELLDEAAAEDLAGEEFYEVRNTESVIHMPDGSEVVSHKVEEDIFMPASDSNSTESADSNVTKGNSKAFEEEMDDL